MSWRYVMNLYYMKYISRCTYTELSILLLYYMK